MLRVSISEMKESMTLARSIPNPSKAEHTLLKPGFKLDKETIDRLRSLRVPGAWINYPSLDFLDELIDSEIVHKQQELYGSLKEQFAENQQLNFAKMSYGEYVRLVGGLFERILTAGNSTHFINDLHGESSDIYRHGTLVASLSALVAARLESYLTKERPHLPLRMAADLTMLGVGCLLHDMGKLHLPEELRDFHLTARDRGAPQWQAHTEAGFDMIKGGLDPTAGQVVINHHQHYDGSGFPVRGKVGLQDREPQPQRGSEIHIFCRIAALVDRFDGLCYLPDGQRAPTVVALKRLRNPGYAEWFDPVIYDAFVKSTPAFAIGEKVTLNNGQEAAVVQINEEQPCRPTVRPVNLEKAGQSDKSDRPDDVADINLAIRSDLHIARVGDFDVTPFLH